MFCLKRKILKKNHAGEPFSIPANNSTQPITNDNPPMGATVPHFVTPVSDKIYSDPENRKIPPIMAIPEYSINRFGYLSIRNATSMSESVWMK